MRTLVVLVTAVLLVSAPQARAQSRSSIPSPDSVFGFSPGADYKLATYDQSIEYFKKLAAASRSIKLIDAGKTTQGRTMYFALISTPENLAKIDRYREIWQRLAHPQGLTDAEARKLAADGKALVHIDGGLHATEVAGPQHTPLLAYDLLSKVSEPSTKAMLENVILMLWPTINPDGQQMVAEWYMKNVGTPYELSGLPQLYQEYVGHDNNRDAYMLNMIESRVIEHTIAREINMIGMAIAKNLDEKGQPGATHMGTAFDAWYPGYIDYAPIFKNIAAYWTETALFSYATPHEYTIAEFPQNMRDLRPRSLYSSPWKPGWWRLRDAVDYMETASLATIEFASKYKDSLLMNRYRAGRDQIAAGSAKAPYGYLVTQNQRDPVAAVELLRRLAFGGVRVSQLTEALTLDEASYPAGTWIIPTDQEFAAMAREVLDIQRYPDLRQYPGGPPERPYDAAGWTLPLQMGVKVVPLATPLTAGARAKMKLLGPALDLQVKPTPYSTAPGDAAPFDSVPGAGFDTDPSAAAIVPPAGRVTGSGPVLSLDPAQNNTYRAINRAWKSGASVQFAGGRYLVGGVKDAEQAELVKSLALVAERTSATGAPVKKPRIGLFRPWSGSMDEGWTRWVLEQYGFEYVTLRPVDFKSPLTGKVDAVILADDARLPLEAATGPSTLREPQGRPEQGRGATSSGQAGRGGRSGGPSVRPEHADRLSPADVSAFEQFVRGGGTVICLNSASTFAIQQFNLPVRNVAAGLRSEDFFLHGTIVEVITDPSQQVMAGMSEKSAVFADNSPVFEIQEGFKGKVLAKYQDSGSPLLSGYLIGEKHLNGKAAALDVQLDNGHVILLGFRPEWRGQPFGTFKVLFNAALSAGR